MDIYPDIPISSNVVAILIPVLDTSIIIIFFLGLIFLKMSERHYVEKRMKTHPEIQDFSL